MNCVFFSPHRPDLLRSDGIPNVDPLPSPSPLSASPKVSTPPGKGRYRSKPRHRRANSKGSHNEFAAVLKPVAGPAEGGGPALKEQQLHQHRPHPPTPGPFLPLKGREEAVVNCANNLRYFGPAAALRSPQTDHLQGRVSSSGPDLICAAVDADTRQQTLSTGSNPAPGCGSLRPCPQAHPFPGCLKCPETSPAFEEAALPYSSQLQTRDGTLPLGSPGNDPASEREAAERPQREEEEARPQTRPLPAPLPRALRPPRKVSPALRPVTSEPRAWWSSSWVSPDSLPSPAGWRRVL